jgi:hypothetical protein
MSLLEVSSGGDDPVGEMQKILTGRLAASQRAKEECYEVLQTATAGKVQKERDALDAIMAESAAEFQKAMTKVHAKWMPNVTAAVTKFQARKSDAVQAARGFTDAEMAHADAVASRDAASSAFNVTRDAISTWLPGATAKRDAEIQKIEKRVIKAKEDGEAKWREVSKVHKEELSKATELINTECEKQIESMGREKQLISRFKGGMLQAAKIKPPPAGPKPETLDCDKKITQGVCCSLDVAQCFACKAGFTTQREYCADGGRKNCEVAGCAACNPKCGKPVEKVKPIKVGCVEEQNAVDAVQAELKAQSELEATEASTQKKMSTTEATCNGEAFNCAETREEDKAKCVADKSQCLVNVDKIRLELTKVQEKIKQSKSAENNLDGRTAKRNKALDECLSRQQLPKKE